MTTLDTATCRVLNFAAVAEDGVGSFDYELPGQLEAAEPPEARGLRRDEVRLMVSDARSEEGDVEHVRFDQIGDFLDAGDVLVINVSGTLPAALSGSLEGTAVHVHLSTQLGEDTWAVEIREPTPEGTRRHTAGEGQHVDLDGGGTVELQSPYPWDRGGTTDDVRLWHARIWVGLPVHDYLQIHGFPIRYGYVPQQWGSEFYQTAFATEPGSAEMPSAGRAFTPELITRLVARGVQFAPLVLHTGVASLEEHEPPYPEWYRVPGATAAGVNAARAAGRRVIAVGTTAVRALETTTDEKGTVHAGEGWTELIIRPDRPMRVVEGLLTGLHEPRATHLAMLLALAGPDHVCQTYAAALEHGYLWHEFGDLHLILN